MIESRHIYFKNLDALRALAALVVVFTHFSYWFVYPETNFYYYLKKIWSVNGLGGYYGVLFFFVLSGFLITYLLFVEQEKNKRINVIYFYIRRLLRIWPLYFFTLLIGFVVYPLAMTYAGYPYNEGANWVMYVIFATNFDHIYFNFPSIGILGVQWSVAVEEQFYLIWPLLFFIFGKSKLFPWLVILIILFSELFYLLVARGLNSGDYHLFNCFRFLAFGALLAYFSFYYLSELKKGLNLIPKFGILIIYILGIAAMYCQDIMIEFAPKYIYVKELFPLAFFGFVIIEQNYSSHSFIKLGEIKILTWMGKISYGIYLLHMIALYFTILLLGNTGNNILLNLLIGFSLTLGLSYFSYNYFEQYFLKFKTKYSRIE